MKGKPLTLGEIELIKSVAEGYTGEKAQEMIAAAALKYLREASGVEKGELTIFDFEGKQQYFRLGDKGHTVTGIHVHMPYATWDVVKGYAIGPLRAGSSAKDIAGLIGDPKLKGTSYQYVGEMLRALQQGRYELGIVTD